MSDGLEIWEQYHNNGTQDTAIAIAIAIVIITEHILGEDFNEQTAKPQDTPISGNLY